MSDTLQKLMTAFVAGDRDAAAGAAKEAIDQLIHDFLFPDEADGMGGMTDMGMGMDMDPMAGMDMGADLGADPMGADLGMDDGHDDLAADPDLALGAPTDGELDALGSVDLGNADLDLEMESVEDLGLSGDGLDLDDAGDEFSTDNDAQLDALSSELDGATADDITGITAEPTGEPTGDVAAEPKTVTGVAVDPEQGDEMVKAVKLTYSDGTDLTFFTLASEVDALVPALQDMIAGDPAMSGDELVSELSQRHTIY